MNSTEYTVMMTRSSVCHGCQRSKCEDRSIDVVECTDHVPEWRVYQGRDR